MQKPGVLEDDFEAGPTFRHNLQAFSDKILAFRRQPCAAESKVSSANLLVGFEGDVTAHHVV